MIERINILIAGIKFASLEEISELEGYLGVLERAGALFHKGWFRVIGHPGIPGDLEWKKENGYFFLKVDGRLAWTELLKVNQELQFEQTAEDIKSLPEAEEMAVAV